MVKQREIIIDSEKYKQFRDTNYYVNQVGKVYSLFSHKILKPYITHDGYERIDCYISGVVQRVKVHRIVYETWINKIDKDYQINHIDDNKRNNSIENLYAGSQVNNINDCIKNKHRVGNEKILIIKDKKSQNYHIFQPALNFLKYSNHEMTNGGVKRCLKRQWFLELYEVIYYNKGLNLKNKNDINTFLNQQIYEKNLIDKSDKMNISGITFR